MSSSRNCCRSPPLSRCARSLRRRSELERDVGVGRLPFDGDGLRMSAGVLRLERCRRLVGSVVEAELDCAFSASRATEGGWSEQGEEDDRERR